jgi:GNAT superfamily N-acetyltransferase
MEKVTVNHRQPTPEEYAHFRETAGWGVPEMDSIKLSLENALYSVCLENNNQLIGLGRVVGDNGVYFYVQDIIVLPEFRGRGYSRIILDEIMTFIKRKAKKGSFVGLFSAKGTEGLYEKYGFVERPNEIYGAGMFLPFKN